MKTRRLKELLLYNYRYWVGYGIIIAFVAYFLGWKLGSLSGGISPQELMSAAQNSSLREILNSPLYPLHSLLQWVSIQLLGVDTLSLRLSSVFLGFFVALFLYQLLRKWFGKPTALLSTAIFISADWFLFISRYSTGGIEFSFWLSLALLCFTKLLERKNKWLLLYAVSLSGLLFTPFGVYAVVTLIISLFACRVFRERAAAASLLLKISGTLLFICALGSIGFLTFKNPEFGKSLLGIENLPSVLEFFKNIFINTSAVAVVLPDSNPALSPNGIFFVRFFELILICFGVIMLFRTRVNRLNLTVLVLTVVLALVSGLNSESRGGGLVLIPAAILMTAGIRHFWYRWQRIFPKNPYARTVAIIPLTVLFVTVVALHYVSYFRLWPSRPATAALFNNDLQLAAEELSKPVYKDKACFIETEDKSLQRLIAASSPVCRAVFPGTDIKATEVFLLKPDSAIAAASTSTKSRPLVDDRVESSVRWLVVMP